MATPTRKRIVCAVSLVGWLAACQAPTGVKSTGKAGSPRPVPSQVATLTASPVATTTAASTPFSPLPIASVPAGPLATATLTGKVKLTPELIARLIGNNGAGIISEHGGGYRLASLPQEAVPGVTVALLDAAGHAVADPASGKPLTATTAADGSYAFTAALPAHNLVVAVALGSSGALQAIAAADAAARAGTDVDLVSSLATTYILDRYVAGQADPVATLDRLPADVERETRLKTATALDATRTALPDDLTAAKVVASVEALRKADAGIDAQLEVVKKLLVLAGQRNLGEGQLATQAHLGVIGQHLAMPDGTAYLACRADRRVWRIDPSGHLEVAAGRGPGSASPAEEGQPASEIDLGYLSAITAGPAGGVWVLGGRRLLLLDAAGKVAKGGGPVDAARGMFDDGQGRALVLLDPTLASAGAGFTVQARAKLVRFEAGQAPTEVKVFDDAESKLVAQLNGLQEAAPGEAWARTFTPGASLVRIDAKGALGSPQALAAGEEVAFELGAGAWHRRGGTWLPPAGSKITPPAGEAWPPLAVLRAEADGSAVFNEGGLLVRLRAGQRTVLAGSQGAADAVRAEDIAFGDAVSLAVDGAGACRVLDSRPPRVWSFKPGGDAQVQGSLPAQTVPLKVLATKDGASWVLDRPTGAGRVLRLASEGTRTTAYEHEAGWQVEDLVVAEDGTLTTLESRAGLYRIGTVPAGGAASYQPVQDPGSFDAFSPVALGRRASGLYLFGPSMWRWLPGQAPTLVPLDKAPFTDDATMWAFNVGPVDAGLAVDATDRVYGASGRIWRFQPTSGKVTWITGSGGLAYQGQGVDDGTSAACTSPVLAANGDLYFLDRGYGQVKRVPADQLK